MLFKRPTRYRHDLLASPKPSRRNTVMNVKARVSSPVWMRNRHVVMLVGTLIGLSLCALFVWLLGRAFFFNNDRFAIQRVIVQVDKGQTLTPDIIKRKTGFLEGTNMFAVDMGEVREEFMRVFPVVQHMEITRILPGTVKILVIERTAVARLGFTSSLCVDSTGHIFGQAAGRRTLPIISGDGVESFAPGHRLDGAPLAALEFLLGCQNFGRGIVVESVKVNGPKELSVRVTYEAVLWEGRLAWNDMGKGSPAGDNDLAQKLAKMKTVFRNCPGERAGSFDARGAEVYVQ